MPRLAIFDIDGTLIAPSTGLLLARGLRDQGVVGLGGLLRGAWYTLLMRIGRIDYDAVIRDAMSVIEGRSVDEVRGWVDAAYDAHMTDRFVPVALERLRAHVAAGDAVCVISATSRLIGDRLARDLPVDRVVCADTEVVDGRITDRLVQPIPYGPGKVPCAEAIAADLGLPLEEATFYTDSSSDLPLLEACGEPVAVNPDPRLRRVARARGWEILVDRGRTALGPASAAV